MFAKFTKIITFLLSFGEQFDFYTEKYGLWNVDKFIQVQLGWQI